MYGFYVGSGEKKTHTHTHEMLQNQQKNPQHSTMNYEVKCVVDHVI